MNTLDLTRQRVVVQSPLRRLLHDYPGVASIALFFALCCLLFLAKCVGALPWW